MKTYRTIMVLDNNRSTRVAVKKIAKCYKKLGLIDYFVLMNNKQFGNLSLSMLCTDEFYVNFLKELKSYLGFKGMKVYNATWSEALIG